MPLRRKNMYDVLIRNKMRESSYEKFFLDFADSQKNTQVVISYQISKDIYNDMEKMMQLMNLSIMEGILSGKT